VIVELVNILNICDAVMQVGDFATRENTNHLKKRNCICKNLMIRIIVTAEKNVLKVNTIESNACDYARSNKPEQRLRIVVVISSAFKGNKP